MLLIRPATPPKRKALSPPPPRTPADPREALRLAVMAKGDPLAALSRMIGRGDAYLGRFIAHGVPAALSEHDHDLLADYFGVDRARGLGLRDLWKHTPRADG